jgi:hypothetical protein
MRSRIQLFISMRILGAKVMRINADPDTDPGQTFKSQNVEFFTLNKIILKIGNRSKNIPTIVQRLSERQKTKFICKLLVIFHAPGSGSGSAFPIRIRIWIQNSQINADLGGSRSATLGKKSLNTIY